MINVTILSQRDQRWANQLLGNVAGATIGNYGCVITCLTSFVNLNDVGAVNKTFINNGVYFNGDEVIWDNVKKALPLSLSQLSLTYYDNTVVAEWVYNKQIPVIVRVDAGPIGNPGGDHYILFVGDHKCMDPWTGTIRPTSDFPILKGYIAYLKQSVQPPTYPHEALAKSSMQTALNETVTASQAGDPNFKTNMAIVKSQAQQIVNML